jgi:prepilin-type N-terminal cleavage/methylation domain-containing protein
MKTSLPKHRRGFTLVEILAVVAIIGLLASIIVPSVVGAQRRAKKVLALQNLKSIAQAYIAYGKPIIGGGEVEEGQANSVAKFAEVLARKGSFETAASWYIDSEDHPPAASIPKSVIEDGANKMEAVKPAAWAVVVNAKKNKWQKTTYPLLWTRGLTADGTWKEDAPWSKEGGHIAFGDGHTVWFDEIKSKENKLIKADDNNNSTTSNYQEAIGTETSGGESSPTRYEDTGG